VMQQINLYQPIFRKQRRVFSARAMLTSLLVGLLGLAAIYGYGAWQLGGLEAEVARLVGERERAAARLVTLGRDLPARRPSQVLASEIDRLERRLAGRRALVAMLSGQIEAGHRFSALLAGLARQRVEGLWLTGLRVAASGSELEIEGSATAPELVPRLVAGLAREPEFRGRRFRTLTIERPEEAPERIDFVLRTAAGEGRGG